jgi:hypothetical protein
LEVIVAATYDINVDQGSTKRFIFTWSRNTGTVDSPIWTPYDLTGCTAKMQIRVAHGKPVLVEITNSTTDGSLTLGGVDGTVAVWLSDENTDLLTVKNSHYDMEITFPSGDTYRILQGRVICSLAITQ